MSRGAKVLYCVYLTLLMDFTGFVTLDTFVIARVETTLEAPQTTKRQALPARNRPLLRIAIRMRIFPFKLIPGGWTIRLSILLM